ncbi:MAG: DNA polymerase-3 subunit gamma/tau [Oleiphilaceae bacterium]|jgi:DNA polymerase-3 subunit gamma/tau
MSYQVLARKWRPQNFKEMVGQEHVLKALINALDSQRLHHAYLFTGTRGVGKTTIGRILAKCLSCDKGITSEPCGTCGACTSIVEGRYVDLIEIDAASRTKVEDMRELLENVQYAPTEGRFKIYLIDEVHMLSQSSFNALLKTLEEPPEHVKFLFATTDPQKLPVTILSRCLQFNLKNMSPERIVGHLNHVLTQEQVTFEEMALWALARAADGSMRDALSLTDQAIAYGNSVLTEVGVSTMLGTVDQKKIYRILDKLVSRDASGMLAEVQSLAEFSPDYTSVLATLAAILHRVAVEQAVPGASDNSMGDQEQVMNYAHLLCAEDVQLFYQVALASRQDLAITPDPKSGLEMALLRMMAFQLSPVEGNKPILPVISQVLDTDLASDMPEASLEAQSSVSDEVPAMLSVENSPPLESYENDASMDEYDSGSNSVTDDYVSETNTAEELKKKTNLADQAIVPVSQGDAELEFEESHQAKREDAVNIADINLAQASEAHVTDSAASLSLEEAAINESDDHTESTTEVGDSAIHSADVSENSQTVGLDVAQTDESSWSVRSAQLGLSGMTLNLLLNSVLEENEQALELYFDSGHYRLLNPSHESRIRAAIQQSYSYDQQINFFNGLKENQETPMMWRDRKRGEMQVQAEQLIKSDPNVLKILDVFDGVLVENSIKAIGEIS